jgi:hypothetical protein
MLEDFTVTTFTDRLGETFHVRDGSDVIELSLIAASEPDERRPAPSGRMPFSIVFRGPLERVLPQRIYPFEHDALGVFELFIVPIGPDESGMQYEAVFG